MNCQCLEDVRNRIEKQLDARCISGTVKGIDECFSMHDGKFITITRSEFEYSLVKPRGRKKKDTISILHSYCPFCGTPTEYSAECARKKES